MKYNSSKIKEHKKAPLNRTLALLRGFGVVVFWILVWQIVSMVVADVLFLPSPIDAFKSLVKLLGTKIFYVDAVYTIYRCLMGILISFVLGALLAAISYRLATVRAILSLPVNFLKATPVMAIIIYALLLLTSGNVPIFVCFLMCFPIVYVNILSGLDNMSRDYLEMVKVFKCSETAKIRWLYIPSVAPEIKASLNLIAGLSWKSVVAAEVLSVPDFSMGYNLMNAKYYLETSNLFAWMIAIVAFAYGFERLIKLLLKKTDRREYKKSKISWKPVSTISYEAAPIVIKDLCKDFGDKVIFKDYSAEFPGNSITGLMAPSGYGKTTLLRMIAGLETIDSGSLKANSQLSYLFQEDRLLPWLSLYDNLALIMRDKEEQAEGKRRIEKILRIMELWDDRNKLPLQLSGGMRHRVAMARAFIYPAGILLLDEPFKGLDEALKKRITEGAWLNTTANKTVILVTHNTEDADTLCDRIVDLAAKHPLA